MSTIHRYSAQSAELPEIRRHDRARYVAEARRLRAEQIDRLLAAAGSGLARLGHALISPINRALQTNSRTG